MHYNRRKNAKKDNTVALIECHILMTEAIRNFSDVELQCSRVRQLREYRNKLPKDIYNKIEEFIEDEILPLIYDMDYFSFLKDRIYGSYDEDGHFIISGEYSLETIISKKHSHIEDLLEKLSVFVYEELHLDYDC